MPDPVRVRLYAPGTWWDGYEVQVRPGQALLAFPVADGTPRATFVPSGRTGRDGLPVWHLAAGPHYQPHER